MGAADFGGEAFKPAQAEIAAGRGVLSGEKPDPMMSQFNSLMDAIGRGEGGPVGVAQNKMQLQALAPLLERQMANKNSTGIAKMETETRRRGQDLGLEGEMARVNAALYGTDVGAETAEKGFEVDKQKAAAAIMAANIKAKAGKPMSLQEQIAFRLYHGQHPDGTPFKTAAERAEAERAFTTIYKAGDPIGAAIAQQLMVQQPEE
jgi:hypothetical protein